MNECIAVLARHGWERMDDVNPKGNEKTPWPYFAHGEWRALIGTLGWVSVYRKTPDGIEYVDSTRTDKPDDLSQRLRGI